MSLYIFLSWLSGKQIAYFLRPIIVSSVVCLAVPHFSILSHKRHDWPDKFFEHKICFDILQICWNICYSKNTATYYHKWPQVFMLSTHYSWKMSVKLKFSRRILEKHSNIKFYENQSCGSRIVSCGQRGEWTEGRTDRHDEANSCCSQICELA